MRPSCNLRPVSKVAQVRSSCQVDAHGGLQMHNLDAAGKMSQGALAWRGYAWLMIACTLEVADTTLGVTSFAFPDQVTPLPGLETVGLVWKLQMRITSVLAQLLYRICIHIYIYMYTVDYIYTLT